MNFATSTRLSAARKYATAFAAALVFLLPPGVAPASAMPASLHSVTIRLQISGGYRYSGTFSISSQSSDSGCLIRHASRASIYAVNFNAQVFRLLQFNRNAFELLVSPYRAGAHRYRGASQEVDVSVGQHYIHGGLFGIRTYVDPKYRITVQIGRNGLAGTFSAQHLQVQHGKTLTSLVRDRYFVAASGSWSCSTVLRV